ncbi:helix-turn-helix transcriptional regulator [Myroides sp. M-43]|uniref:helix-turn-helix domain-containing protein n=1 Tax=Myroides oncorhynchi TaxID=2893756 RepID=UPI001E6325B6|nr:helix-turn-helix transcriptional regulator [Myroides oncorhynchi]MCC9043584.1 helix-turn-helix transcriptional regulator [Myroides oncorhynchi]
MHKIDDYIKIKMQEEGITEPILAQKSGLSTGHINKLKNGNVAKLSASTFYKLVTAFDRDFVYASDIVFPTLKNIELNKLPEVKRNKFGTLMLEFEKVINTPKNIAIITGISEERIFELFNRNGGLEAYELLLIEKAIKKKVGELFILYFKDE